MDYSRSRKAELHGLKVVLHKLLFHPHEKVLRNLLHANHIHYCSFIMPIITYFTIPQALKLIKHYSMGGLMVERDYL